MGGGHQRRSLGRRALAASLCLVGVLAGGPTAAEAPPAALEKPVVKTCGAFTMLRLRLDDALVGLSLNGDNRDNDTNRYPLTVHLFVRDGRITGGYGTHPDQNCPFSLQWDELALEPSRLHGTLQVMFRSEQDSRNWFAVYEYAIDARIDGPRVAGKYTGRATRGKKPPALEGAVSGDVLSDAQVREAVDALPEGADFPSWRGERGNGAGPDAGVPMVDSADAMRLLWKSEAFIPWSTSDHDVRTSLTPDSDFASPIVYRGRVYFTYGLGSQDTPIDDEVRERIGDRVGPGKPFKEEGVKQTISALADDIVLALDARTGATCWKTVIPKRGKNAKRAHRLTPCAADGKIYAMGWGGHAYCLDADTGRLIWESEGVDADTVQSYCSDTTVKMKKGKPRWPGGRPSTFYINPVFAGGVLVCGYDSWLVGFDGRTGKVLWSVDGICRDKSSPVKWTYQGKDYVVDHQGCLDPKDGKVLWRFGFAAGTIRSSPVLWENYMLTTHGGSAATEEDDAKEADAKEGAGEEPPELKSHGGLVCYQISPAGAKQAWKQPGLGFSARAPVIQGGHVYVGLGGRAGGMTFAVDVKTGTITGKAPFKGSACNIFSSPAASDGLIIQERLWLFKADPKDPVLLGGRGGVAVPTAMCCTPAVAAGRAFYRTSDGILCYDLRKR